MLLANIETTDHDIETWAYTLGVGYAYLGHIRASGFYIWISRRLTQTDIAFWNDHAMSQILPLYINNNRLDLAIESLNRQGNHEPSCHRIAKFLSGRRDTNSLEQVIEQTKCDKEIMLNACKIMSAEELEVFLMMRSHTLTQREGAQCLHERIWTQNGTIEVEDLTKIFPIHDPEILDEIKAAAAEANFTWSFKQVGRAEKILSTIGDKNLQKKLASKLIAELAHRNDFHALELEKLYPLQSHNPRYSFTEVAFVLWMREKGSQEKFYFLRDLLEAIVSRDKNIQKEEHDLSPYCGRLEFKECVFQEITKTYESLPSNKVYNERDYLKAMAMAGHYGFLNNPEIKTKYSEDSIGEAAITMAKYDPECEIFLEKKAAMILAPGGNDSIDNNLDVYAITECALTTGRAKKLFTVGNQTREKRIPLVACELIHNRILHRPDTALNFIELLDDDLSFLGESGSMKEQIINISLQYLRNAPENLPPEVINTAMQTIFSYIKENYFAGYVLNFIGVLEKVKNVEIPQEELLLLKEKADQETKKMFEEIEVRERNRRGPQHYDITRQTNAIWEEIKRKTQIEIYLPVKTEAKINLSGPI